MRAWFDGPVAESYPVQAGALTIVIDRGHVVMVKARHGTRLMALPRMVGIGIGSREDRVCIVFMVEAQTPWINKQVAGALKGFPVCIEGTGPIVLQSRARISTIQGANLVLSYLNENAETHCM